MSLAYGAHGAALVSGELAGSVTLWDGRTGTRMGTVTVDPDGDGVMPRLLPDGRTVLIVSMDGQVFRWDLRRNHWIDAGCRIAGRDLTRSEWRSAFGDRPFERTCPRDG
jgi:WD40 repeat protein